MITKNCITCKTQFKTYKSRYCSLKCWYSTIKGNGNPFWKKKTKLSCKECQKVFEYDKHKLGKNPTFCSVKCRAKNPEWRKKMGRAKSDSGIYVGDKNPNWRGGISRLPYPISFNGKLKKEVMQRDGYMDQLCGIDENFHIKKYRQKLVIHHIDYNKMNCNLDNLITLCLVCNSRVNFGREDWTRYFQDKLKTFSNK